MLLLERPHFVMEVGMLARKGGIYSRPIIGSLVDIRIEDFLEDRHLKSTGFIGKLPDVGGQSGLYFTSSGNVVDRVNVGAREVEGLMGTGQFVMLPHNNKSSLWQGRPWWEYTVVIDDHNGYVKAPLFPRPGEPSAAEVDEKLDYFIENRGKLKVRGPSTLEKSGAISRDRPFEGGLEAAFG